MAYPVKELMHAAFRTDGTVSVGIVGSKRRFLTTLAGMREGLDELEIRNVVRTSSARAFEMFTGGMFKLEHGKFIMAQVFPACDAEIMHHSYWVTPSVDRNHTPERFIEMLNSHNVLVSSSIGPVNNGRRPVKAMLRVRLPIRLWIGSFKLTGKLDDPGDLRLYTLMSMPASAEELPTLVRRWEASNVYAEANICWGPYAEQLKDFASLKEVDRHFIGSPFNDDLQSFWHWASWQSWLEVSPTHYPNNVRGGSGTVAGAYAECIPYVQDGRIIIPPGHFQPAFVF